MPNKCLIYLQYTDSRNNLQPTLKVGRNLGLTLLFHAKIKETFIQPQ